MNRWASTHSLASDGTGRGRRRRGGGGGNWRGRGNFRFRFMLFSIRFRVFFCFKLENFVKLQCCKSHEPLLQATALAEVISFSQYE